MAKDKAAFTAERFTATEWESAEQKAEFAREFVRFVESGFEKGLFTKSFYRRLSNTFGHIAHYDRGGFYEEFFTTAEDKVRFIQQALDHPCYGDPAFTYSDVERALQGWLRESRVLETFQEEARHPSGAVRAERFAALLSRYPEGKETNCIDLLTDCLQWCEQVDMDFERLLLWARSHFEAERQEEHRASLEVDAPDSEQTKRPPRQHER